MPAAVPGKGKRHNIPALFWWCGHVVALIILFLITDARGLWFWTVGLALVISSYAGQIALNRRASRSTTGSSAPREPTAGLPPSSS